jgi:hypothetical protein
MKFYGLTITSNKLESYKDDSLRISNVMQDLALRGYATTCDGWEVQPNGRHLLHVHSLMIPLSTCKETQPYLSTAYQKAKGINAKIEELVSLKLWTKYVTKQYGEDAIWTYQQHHTDMLQ